MDIKKLRFSRSNNARNDFKGLNGEARSNTMLLKAKRSTKVEMRHINNFLRSIEFSSHFDLQKIVSIISHVSQNGRFASLPPALQADYKSLFPELKEVSESKSSRPHSSS